MSARPQLTPHQRYYLDALRRRKARWDSRTGWFVRAKELGGKQVWYHLYEKGYIDIDNEVGPGGGYHLLVRLKEI